MNWSNESFFCDCSPVFGWTGENCDEASPMLVYLRVTKSLFLVWSLGGFAKTMYEMHKGNVFKSFQENDTSSVLSSRNRLAAKIPSHLVYVGVETALTFLFLAIANAAGLAAVCIPDNYSVDEFRVIGGMIEMVTSPASKTELFALFFSVCATIVTTLHISFSWLAVADSLVNFNFIQKSKPAKILKVFGKMSVPLLIIIAIPVAILEDYWIIVILAPMYVALLAVLIHLGRRRFQEVLDLALSFEKKKSMRIVNVSSQIVVVLLPISPVLLLIVYSLQLYYTKITRPGRISFIAVLHDAAVGFPLALTTTFLWYISQMFKLSFEYRTASVVSSIARRE